MPAYNFVRNMDVIQNMLKMLERVHRSYQSAARTEDKALLMNMLQEISQRCREELEAYSQKLEAQPKPKEGYVDLKEVWKKEMDDCYRALNQVDPQLDSVMEATMVRLISNVDYEFMGMQTREESEADLKNKSVGSFVTRYSTSQKGMLVLSYVKSPGVVEHVGQIWSEAQLAHSIAELKQKVVNDLAVEEKVAPRVLVLSTQDPNMGDSNKYSVEQARVLTAQQISAEKSKIGGGVGDGRSSLAIAELTGGTFAVVRSEDNRKELKHNPVMRNAIGNNGWLVITGHGAAGFGETSGDYISGVKPSSPDKLKAALQDELGVSGPLRGSKKSITREAKDFVETAMLSGLGAGMHVNVLLSICHGAQESAPGRADSFAHQLAQEFLNRGVTVKIVASEGIVHRYGFDKTAGRDQIPFDNGSRDIKNNVTNVRVFTTDTRGKITVAKADQEFKIGKQGMGFANELKWQEALAVHHQRDMHRDQKSRPGVIRKI